MRRAAGIALALAAFAAAAKPRPRASEAQPGAAPFEKKADSPRALADRIEDELEAWDVESAAAQLDALSAAAPGSALAAYYRGRVLFEQGQYDAAVQAFLEAQKDDDDQPASLAQDLALAKATAAEVKGDDVHESAHFTLRTRPGKDALLVPYALAGLERAYAALTQDLGIAPRTKIRVEVYESAQALARVSPLTVAEIKASGTIALCKYDRLMITTPRALLRGYSWQDTLAHEFVHYLVTKKGRANVPIWLQEGLAKFLETRWRGPPGLAVDQYSQGLLTKAAKSGTLIPFAAMHPSIAKLPTQEAAALAFAEVEAAMKLLFQRGGQAALTELVAAMAHGFTDEAAVAQAYGKSFPQFEADWRAAVAKTQAAKAGTPAHQKALVFKEDARRAPKAEPEPGGDAASDTDPALKKADPEAKKALRLGELMLERRRFGAAAIEYGRARARLREEVPFVSRRYALAQLAIGKLDEAEAALAAATAQDPQDEAAQALYAKVLAGKGALDRARAALDAGLSIDPFDPDLHGTYVLVATKLNDQPLLEQEKRAFALARGQAVPESAPQKAPKEKAP